MKKNNILKSLGLVIILVLSSCASNKFVYQFSHQPERVLYSTQSPENELSSLSKGENINISTESNPTSLGQDFAILKPMLSIDEKISGIDLIRNYSKQDQEIQNNKNKFPDFLKSKLSEIPIKNQNSKFKIFKTKKIMESQELKEDGGYSGFAIAGFVCGILGLLLVLSTGWPFLLGTLGTIFSSIGLSQTLNGRKGKGFAIAGLVAGILAIFIFWRLVFFLAGLATII